MIRFILSMICMFVLNFVYAQPMHVSFTGTSSNIFPLSTTGNNKIQVLYSPSDFTPSLAGGPKTLTKFYIYANTNSANVTYSNLSVKIGHVANATFTSNAWLTGLTQVYLATSRNFTGVTIGSYLEFVLTTPFVWDGVSNIAIEISQTAYSGSGINLLNYSSNGSKRIWGSQASPTPVNFGTGQAKVGFDVAPLVCMGMPNNGNISAVNTTVACGTSASLSIDNQSAGPGITMVWEKSEDAGATWTSFATNVVAPTLNNVVRTTQVRVVTTCSTSNLSAISNILTLDVSQAPFSLGNDSVICDGTNINLSVTAFSPQSVIWDDSSTALIRNITHPGSYAATVTFANTCVSNDTIVIMDGIEPTNPFAPEYNLCIGDSVVLNAQNNGMDYLWHDMTTNQTLSVTSTGNYHVTITSRDECTATFTPIVVERPIPVINLPITETICEGDSVRIDGTSLHGNAYLWNDNVTTPIRYIKQAGVHSLRVTTAYGCVAEEELELIHRPLPTTGGYSFVPGFYELAKDVQFVVITPQNVDSYLWDFGDGNTSNLQNPIHTYAAFDDYNVTLSVFNNCGQVDYNQTIDVDDGTTGIDAIAAQNTFQLYPNPTSTILNIKSDKQVDEVSVLSLDGKILYQSKIDNKQIDVSNLANGIYLLQIKSEEQVWRQKFEVIK